MRKHLMKAIGVIGGVALLFSDVGPFGGSARAAAFDTTLVNRVPFVGVKANNGLEFPEVAVSSDGRFVAFDSNATDLSFFDLDDDPDVYVRDLQTGSSTLVSRASDGATGSGPSSHPSISADGRFVAFQSNAVLDPIDTDLDADVYVRDLVAQTTRLVSRGTGPAAVGASGDTGAPAISGNGRYVAYQTVAGMQPGEGDGEYDIYVYDLQEQVVRFVSRATGEQGANLSGHSWGPSISYDGRVIAFSSQSNFDPADSDADIRAEASEDVYVRDMQTLATTLVSRTTGANTPAGNNRSTEPAISSSGRYVAFTSSADLVPPDATGEADIYVRDIHANSTTLVSRATNGAKANRLSAWPSISASGRYVAFSSMATNLDAADPDTYGDVYVRDRQTGVTTLASRATGPTGAKGNGHSIAPAIAATGRIVAFASSATNLHPDDNDTVRDIYARELPAPENALTGVIGINPPIDVPLVDDPPAVIPPIRRLPIPRR